ncbi:M67 family metallopeptidase [Paenibacillus sp. PL2-23]|uniref:M67 family metallopeptidase n=1 Tax=Paenibacillus sp. PL2-23 TaxID=2100729 RepID=UPI0030F5570F
MSLNRDCSILQSTYHNLITVCTASYPQEACGILACSSHSAAIDIIIPITNAHPRPQRAFAFDPVEWTSVFFSMQKNRQQLVGFFHSHPASAPLPSPRDERGFLPQTGMSYWVISLMDEERPLVQPYRQLDGQFQAIPLMLA